MTHEMADTRPGARRRWPPANVSAALMGPLNIGLMFLFTNVLSYPGSPLGAPFALSVAVVELLGIVLLLKARGTLTVTRVLAAVVIDIISTGACLFVTLIIGLLISPPGTVDN